MKAQDILTKASETMAQRGQQNGYDNKEERSASAIAAIYDSLSGKAPGTTSAADAWRFLRALKLARLQSQTANGSGDTLDTVTDLIAYAALLGEEISGAVNATPRQEGKEDTPVAKYDPEEGKHSVEGISALDKKVSAKRDTYYLPEPD